jgi:hypothetical protein
VVTSDGLVRRIALLLLLATATGARADLITLYGSERAGSSGGQFLRIPVGGRAVALGNAGSAMASGPTAMFSNPGALSTVRYRNSLFASHFAYAADINIGHVGYVRRTASWQFGFGFGVLDAGEIERTTERSPSGTGQTFRADQIVAQTTVSRLLTDRFTLGLTSKYLQETLDDYHVRAVLFDLGALYFLGHRAARIGFAMNNFGPDLQLNGAPPPDAGFQGSWQSFSAPTTATFGFAYDLPSFAGNTLTLDLDFVHPTDESESIVYAGELNTHYLLALRGAYRYDPTESILTGGFGLQWRYGRNPIRLDYGFADRESFGLLHTITLEIEG